MMIQARYFGPGFAAGQPTVVIIHSVESGIVPGLGEQLALGWFRNPSNETSAHGISDPAAETDMVPDAERAWHCGTGNAYSLGFEHTGRAAFTRAEWTTPDGLKMLRLSAARTAKACRDHGIPARWLSLAQMAAGAKGLATHNDARLVWGGTTHTDPGPGFPYDLYLQYVNEALGNVPRPPVTEAPTPTPPEEDDMPTAKEIVDELLSREFTVRDASAKPEAIDKTFTLGKLIPFLVNLVSQGTRDAYALRNTDEPGKGIDKALRRVLTDDGIIGKWRLKLWDTPIDAEKPSRISFGEALRRTWKTVTGSGAASTTDATPNGEQS